MSGTRDSTAQVARPPSTALPIASTDAEDGTPRRGSATRTAAAKRIVGVDVARGLAIIGMMSVHILDSGEFPWVEWMADSWDEHFAGRSSILFAIIAGISVALMTGREIPVTGAKLVQARTRLLVRAVIIFAIGSALSIPVHNVAVILEYYAVLFVLILPFLTWNSGRLFNLAAAATLVLPVLYQIILNLALRDEFGRIGTLTRLMFTGHYPAIVWIIFMLIGLGLGRLNLTATRVQLQMLAVGLAMVLAGYYTGNLAERAFPITPRADGEVPDRFYLGRTATADPHTGTWFEIVGSSGVAIAVLAIFLLATPRFQRVLQPMAAAGSMALSIYVIHVISMVWISPRLTDANQYQYFLVTVIVTLIVSTAWARTMGRGPLERLLTNVSRRAATARRPAPATGPR